MIRRLDFVDRSLDQMKVRLSDHCRRFFLDRKLVRLEDFDQSYRSETKNRVVDDDDFLQRVDQLRFLQFLQNLLVENQVVENDQTVRKERNVSVEISRHATRSDSQSFVIDDRNQLLEEGNLLRRFS